MYIIRVGFERKNWPRDFRDQQLKGIYLAAVIFSVVSATTSAK